MFAKIDNGAIVEWSTFIPTVPEGEAPQDWRPLVQQWPEFDARTHFAGDPVDTIEAERVLRTWPVLAKQITAAELIAYAAQRHQLALNSGVTIDGVHVSTDAAGRVDMAGAVSLAQLVPTHTFDWVCMSGPVQLTSAQIIALGTAVGLHVQDTYTAYGQAVAGINDGTITSFAAIDAAIPVGD